MKPGPIAGDIQRESTQPSLLLYGLLGVGALVGAAGLGALVAVVLWDRLREALLDT